jgi:FSR family fosmidomycin resistance protein-like MFS transporter
MTVQLTLQRTPQQAFMTGTRLAALLTVSHMAVDGVASMPAALLPTIQTRFGLTETGLALLVAVLSFSSSVTQPLFGALADRLGQRRVAALGAMLTAGVLSLLGIAPSIALLVGIFLLGGVGSAAFHPGGASMARAASTRQKGLGVSLFSAGGTIGVALGPIIVVSVIAVYGLQATPWLMIPGMILGALILLAAPAPPRATPRQRTAGSRTPGLSRAVRVLSLAGIFNSIAFVTFNAVPLWLVASGVARDSSVIGWTLATFALSAAAGGITASVLMHRVPRAYLASGTMLSALLPLLSIFVVEPGTPLFFGVVILAGALMQASVPLLVVSAQDLAPDAVATVSGMLMGFTTGVAGILSIGIGYLQEVIGIEPAMQLAFLALIPAALIAFSVLNQTRKSGASLDEMTDDSSRCPCQFCQCWQ